ncbi:hypothetical protein BH10PLA1_BH10PLA1_05290 [soil metagenome]
MAEARRPSNFSGLSESGMPTSIYEYDVIDFIGEGAGSVLYVVSHHETKQIYALKHVIRKTDKHARFIEQVENEFNVGQKVKHPNLRAVVALRETKSLLRKTTECALVLEMFDGTPLDMQQTPSIERLLNCFIDTGKAIEALHHAGFVHCDLKPNNILLSTEGVTKVIDLGQACPVGTKKERIQGTPDYIAPEQVRCEPVTQRTDVFNFGATMYWSLTGRKIPTLFTLKKAKNSFLVDDVIASPTQINPKVPEMLSNLVMECVRTTVAKRPGDMGELVSRLETMDHALHHATLTKKVGA